MKTTTGLLTAGLLCVGLLAGCSSDGGAAPQATPSTSEPSTAPPSASTASDVAQAAALATVKRFVQMTQVDMFTGDATLNDLPKVAAQPLLDLQRKASRDLLTDGWVSKTGGEVKFDELKVVSATPKSDPRTVVVRFCADATGIDYVRLNKSGDVAEKNRGVRRGTTATVQAKDYGDGWFVTKTELFEC